MKNAEKIISIIILAVILSFAVFLCSLKINDENYNGLFSFIHSEIEETQEISSNTSHNTHSSSSSSTSLSNNKTPSTNITNSASQKPTASVASSVTSNSKMVWITKTGKRYHKISYCGNTKSAIQVAQKDAEALCLTPCENCW